MQLPRSLPERDANPLTMLYLVDSASVFLPLPSEVVLVCDIVIIADCAYFELPYNRVVALP